MQQAAKQISSGPQKLFRWLRDQHVLTANNLPTQIYIDSGLLKIRHGGYHHPIKGELETQRAVFTRNGMAWLKTRWAEDHQEN